MLFLASLLISLAAAELQVVKSGHRFVYSYSVAAIPQREGQEGTTRLQGTENHKGSPGVKSWRVRGDLYFNNISAACGNPWGFRFQW